MKAKLIRYNGSFYLIDENTKITSHHHLSKQNCDEIFGVVDVEKLAEENTHDCDTSGCYPADYFIAGFNKAMELNKDKVFTLEDMNNAMDWIMTQYFEFHEQPTTGRREQYLESIQQPTEIEVQIVMEEVQEIYRDGTVKWERCPKLDSEGRLVLTKKI